MTGGQESVEKENPGNPSTSPGQVLLCPALSCSHFYILWPALGGHPGRQGAGPFKEGSKEFGVGFSAKQASKMKEVSPRTHLYQIPRGYVPRILMGGGGRCSERQGSVPSLQDREPDGQEPGGLPGFPWLSEKGAETLQPHMANN